VRKRTKRLTEIKGRADNLGTIGTQWTGEEWVMRPKHFPKGLDDRQRDQYGEIRKQRSDTKVDTLRKEYGPNFAGATRRFVVTVGYEYELLPPLTHSGKTNFKPAVDPCLSHAWWRKVKLCQADAAGSPFGNARLGTGSCARRTAPPRQVRLDLHAARNINGILNVQRRIYGQSVRTPET
jgi:hypothetical protein